ncbi:MAG: dihydrodipicolinate reductase [Acidobacteria bacterium]|nr:MAG: dihydrodipicolinate reductase [Acidobacteriota bacterium]
MKIALIGCGAMGQLVSGLATKAGDEVGYTVTSAMSEFSSDQLSVELKGHDVAIDFSVAEAIPRNIEACVRAGVPIVEGTTGWKTLEDEIKHRVEEQNGALVYGANFSIGVNVFYRIVSNASRLFSMVEGLEEAHHSRKRDAPSGTALRLRDLMTDQLKIEIPTSSTRAGFIPGTHRVGFDSEADQITLTHMARSRQGFAAGALVAARWIVGRKGVYEFGEVVDELLSRYASVMS